MKQATYESARRKARQQVFSDNPAISARANRILDLTAARLRTYWRARERRSAYADAMWM